MAETFQASILTARPARMHSFCLLDRHSPASRSIIFRQGRSINSPRCFASNRKRFISLPPIRACQPSDKAGGNGSKSNVPSSSEEGLKWTERLSNFVSDNFLPLALVSGVTLGLLNPSIGCAADKLSLSKFSPVGIFIISGLTLRSEAIGAAAKAWSVGIFGLCSILFCTPCFSRLIMQIHLQPQEFVTGLAIFCCMPTTLSSGVALTNLAGGNAALALAMTVISNLLGILIVPFSISKYIAGGVGVTVPTKQLFKSLLITLLIPLIFGKVLRESFKGVANLVDQNRQLFSRISAILLSLAPRFMYSSSLANLFAMLEESFGRPLSSFRKELWRDSLLKNSILSGTVPWIQVSKSRSLLVMVKPSVFLVAIGMGMLLHVLLLVFNALSLKMLSAVSGGKESLFAKRENDTAVLLVASQKTLPVMVAVVDQLGGAFGESGLLVLPCVAAHLIQIVMDSFLVSFWLRRKNNASTAKAKLA